MNFIENIPQDLLFMGKKEIKLKNFRKYFENENGRCGSLQEFVADSLMSEYDLNSMSDIHDMFEEYALVNDVTLILVNNICTIKNVYNFPHHGEYMVMKMSEHDKIVQVKVK